MRARGFTLLELMVAVAVLALVAAMVHANLHRHVSSARVLENRALAAWLADTALAERQLQGVAGAGISETIHEQGKRRWKVVQEVQATAQPELWLVRVEVSDVDSKDGGVVLTGFVGAQR